MITCKEEAERWVHLYAVGGAVFAAVPFPFSTAPVLATLETHLMTVIGDIYGESLSGALTAAAGGTFTVLGSGLKVAVQRATAFVPVVGPVIRTVTAIATIEAIGQAIITHYERKYPGKMFTRASARDASEVPASAPNDVPKSAPAAAVDPQARSDIFSRSIKISR